MPQGLPFIPETITVHLGAPDSNAPNITVPFEQYIKNVASSEIYPNWPESAIRANILAQISFALNRIYTEYYRSRGYNFDITNSTAVDQSFVNGRDIFENISLIVDDIFDNYITREGNVEPLFAQYCNGTTSSCAGLSQWGSVTLANQGLVPFEILQNYYGDNISIQRDAPVRAPTESYPGRALRLGTIGNDVRTVQIQLNRVSQNYPAIPKISNVNSIFDEPTQAAVIRFQEIFNLTPDGIVGKNTWYKLSSIYSGVKRLNEINSEGIRLSDISRQFPGILREGDSGNGVLLIQYYLDTLSFFYPDLQSVRVTGNYDAQTTSAVRAFQTFFGLDADGIVGRNTWNKLYDAFETIRPQIVSNADTPPLLLPPGTFLLRGSSGEYVRQLQEWLVGVSSVYTEIPAPPVNSFFGTETENSVIAFERYFGINPTGIVGPITWDFLYSVYSDIASGTITNSGQFPGYTLTEGTTD